MIVTVVVDEQGRNNVQIQQEPAVQVSVQNPAAQNVVVQGPFVRGPQGVQGPQGPQGIQGPPGTAVASFEAVSKNIQSNPYDLVYTSGRLTSIVYDLGGGQAITKTFNYTGPLLTSIVLSGDTPGGIQLTKALNYTSGVLESISYS